jgi:hypothetical protein
VTRNRISIGRSVGVGGRIFGSLFFFVFLAMGLAFCVFIGREVYLGAKTYTWPRVECVILDSRVVEDAKDNRPYRFQIRYEYQWRGRTHTTEKWSRRGGAYSDYSDAQRLTARYPLDSKAVCFVNPRDPTEALLERPGLWIGFLILLPLIFVGIGGIGLVAMWTKAGDAPSDPVKSRPKPISSVSASRTGTKFAVGLLAVFFVIGAVVSYFITVRPLLQVLSARDWTVTPCTIVSSRVQSHRGDDGTTYRVDILYRYEFAGREHRSNRYQFVGGSSSGYQGKARIVGRHPVGAQRTCYVNPRNPAEAVLERGLTPEMWFGAIPVVFMLVGAVGTIAMLRRQPAGHGRFGPAHPEPVPVREIIGAVSPGTATSSLMDDPSAPRVLKPANSRLAGLIAIGVFGAIWNGILWFVFLPDIGIFRRSSPGVFDWIHLLFLLPFLAVGLVLIGVVIYQWLSLYNPKVELTITPGVPALGGRLDLAWRLTGRTHILRDLKIILEAREEATYQQGTRTSTDRKVFFTLDAAAASEPAALPEGRASITLPADTVPSFKATNNRIIWSVRVTGEIPRWPDLKEEFVIEVAPPARLPAAT